MEDEIWRNKVDPDTVHLTGEDPVQVDVIENEIDLVIRARISGFRGLRARRGISDDAHQVLLEKMTAVKNRTCLWVSLVFSELERQAGLSRNRLLGLVRDLPTSVEEAYEEVLERSPDVREAQRILNIVVAATRPLLPEELSLALTLDDYGSGRGIDRIIEVEPAESFGKRVRELCGLFIRVQANGVYLIHQTAKDFLIQSEHKRKADRPTHRQLKWKDSIVREQAELTLAKVSIQTILWSGIRSKEDLHEREFEATSGLGAYPYEFWHYHLANSNIDASRATSEKVFF